MFINCSTCFEQHTAHHQELKNCNCSLWFYICLWLPAAVMAQPWQLLATTNVCVSLKTCRAIKKHWNNNFYYTVASCWLFLYDFYYDEQIHEHQVQKFVYLFVCLFVHPFSHTGNTGHASYRLQFIYSNITHNIRTSTRYNTINNMYVSVYYFMV